MSTNNFWESVAICSFLNLEGYYVDQAAATEVGLTVARALQKRQNESAWLGYEYQNLGRVEEAIECYGQALVIASETGDRRK